MTATDETVKPSIATLVEQHYAVLYRYAYRLTGSGSDADDLTQQTFLVAQTKLHQLREAEYARAWLFTILRNAFLKEHRSHPGNGMVPLDAVSEPESDLTPDNSIDEEQLQRILNELPEEFRTPILLYYFEQLSYKEIAARMETPVGTIMSRLARAKATLRRRLSRGDSTPDSIPPQ